MKLSSENLGCILKADLAQGQRTYLLLSGHFVFKRHRADAAVGAEPPGSIAVHRNILEYG